MKTKPRFKIGDPVYYNKGDRVIHGEIYNHMYEGVDGHNYLIRTNELSSYLGCQWWVSENSLEPSEEPFIYDTNAEDECWRNNKELCFKLGIVTPYNEDMFMQ